MGMQDARDAFSGLHPGPCYLFFGFMVVFTVIFMHPVVLGVSFFGATAYAVYLGRGKAVRFTLCFLLPVMLLAAVLNPAFNHRGATILFYLWTGNPVTAESLLYGVAGALMIGSIIQWFYCYNAMMTSDKFLWLFGRAMPALSLVISMALRLVPHYTARVSRIASARQGLGRGVEGGNVVARAREGLSILSVMTTWALENAVDTADSMASRGFGTGRRTAYSNYRLTRRDMAVLVFFVLAGLVCAVLVALGVVEVAFFPHFELGGNAPATILLTGAWLALCVFPLALGLWEDAVWRSLRSEM
jgi:energy-coupling factor transport system permease protein